MTPFKNGKRNEMVNSNIKWNFIFKGISVILSFFLLSFSTRYLTKVEYGIWATLFSILNWINFLDVGIGLGMRNKLAESVSKRDFYAIKEYISVGFFSVLGIGILFMIVFLFGIFFIDFNRFFNTNDLTQEQLFIVVLYAGIFVIFSFIFSIINQIFFAFQKSAMVALLQVVHNAIMLLSVFSLLVEEKSGLLFFVISFGLSVILSRMIFSVYFFRKYRGILPNIKLVNLSKMKEISTRGIEFFILQIMCIVNFFMSNILITKLLGPENVLLYDVIFKVYGIISMIHFLVLSPLWSAYTDAYVKKDFNWIRGTLYKTIIFSFFLAIVALFLGIYMKEIVKIWIGIDIECSRYLIGLIAIYVLIIAWNNNFAYLLNGIDKVSIQIKTGIIGVISLVPLAIYLTKYMEMHIEGIVLASILSLFFPSIIIPLYTFKFLNKCIKSKKNF